MTDIVPIAIPPIDSTKIVVTSIRLLSGNIAASTIAAEIDQALLFYQTEVKAKNSVNVPQKEFTTLLTINLEMLDSENNKIGVSGEFQLEIRLKVENIEQYILPSIERDGQKIIVIHNTLTGTLMGIAYSTSRGIVFMRTLGSALEGAILPVIDPLKIPGVYIP